MGAWVDIHSSRRHEVLHGGACAELAAAQGRRPLNHGERMATFKNVYKAGNGYSPVRLFIQNTTNKPFFYNLRGVTDAFGNALEPYGHQTQLFSTYQAVRNGTDPNADLRDMTTSMITKTPLLGLLKVTYYTGKVIFKGYDNHKIEEAMKKDGYVTNYRAGYVKAKESLFVELGSIPVDGRLNNKGWALTTDVQTFKDSFIGPCEGQSEEEDALSAHKNGPGIAFWGEKTGFWSGVKGDLFNFNVNWRWHAGLQASYANGTDVESIHQFRAGLFTYVLEHGGVSPGRTDFINMVIRNA
jgi:hypothetical protein